MTIKLNKSKFVAGCQCLKRLYLQVHEPELAAEPDAAAEAIIEQGREVGLLARQMFPGGVEVRSERGFDQAIRATREILALPLRSICAKNAVASARVRPMPAAPLLEFDPFPCEVFD